MKASAILERWVNVGTILGGVAGVLYLPLVAFSDAPLAASALLTLMFGPFAAITGIGIGCLTGAVGGLIHAFVVGAENDLSINTTGYYVPTSNANYGSNNSTNNTLNYSDDVYARLRQQDARTNDNIQRMWNTYRENTYREQQDIRRHDKRMGRY